LDVCVECVFHMISEGYKTVIVSQPGSVESK
jgi:hypothetical protein